MNFEIASQTWWTVFPEPRPCPVSSLTHSLIFELRGEKTANSNAMTSRFFDRFLINLDTFARVFCFVSYAIGYWTGNSVILVHLGYYAIPSDFCYIILIGSNLLIVINPWGNSCVLRWYRFPVLFVAADWDGNVYDDDGYQYIYIDVEWSLLLFA